MFYAKIDIFERYEQIDIDTHKYTDINRYIWIDIYQYIETVLNN